MLSNQAPQDFKRKLNIYSVKVCYITWNLLQEVFVNNKFPYSFFHCLTCRKLFSWFYSSLATQPPTWIFNAKDKDCPFNNSSPHFFPVIFMRTLFSPSHFSKRLISKLASSSFLLLQFAWPSKSFSAPVPVSSHLPWIWMGQKSPQKFYITPLPCLKSLRISNLHWNMSSDKASRQNQMVKICHTGSFTSTTSRRSSFTNYQWWNHNKTKQ